MTANGLLSVTGECTFYNEQAKGTVIVPLFDIHAHSAAKQQIDPKGKVKSADRQHRKQPVILPEVIVLRRIKIAQYCPEFYGIGCVGL